MTNHLISSSRHKSTTTVVSGFGEVPFVLRIVYCGYITTNKAHVLLASFLFCLARCLTLWLHVYLANIHCALDGSRISCCRTTPQNSTGYSVKARQRPRFISRPIVNLNYVAPQSALRNFVICRRKAIIAVATVPPLQLGI